MECERQSWKSRGRRFSKEYEWKPNQKVHDLPIGCLKLRVAQDITSVAGDVINTGAADEDYEGSHFLRVRVRIDITKPLCRSRKIGLSIEKEGFVEGADKQFGSWLRATTPNLTKKTVVRVMGYEEEVNKNNGAIPNSDGSDGGDRNELNGLQNNGDSDHHQSTEYKGRVANFDVLHVQAVAPVVVEDDGTPEVSDVELGRFDGGKENGKGTQDCMVSGVGDRLNETARLVENSPIQSGLDSVSSTQRLELWSLKRTRKDSKTWSSKEHMKWVRDRILFDSCFTIPSDYKGGGLALLWKAGTDVWVDSFSNYHIDYIVHGGLVNACRLTDFYGEPDTGRRRDGWNMLRMLSSKPQLP
nr:hypothetical protein CFP56_41678 [Quercus suber]